MLQNQQIGFELLLATFTMKKTMKTSKMNIRLLLLTAVLAISALSCAKTRNEYNFSKAKIEKRPRWYRNISAEADSHKCFSDNVKERMVSSHALNVDDLARLLQRLETISYNKDTTYPYYDGVMDNPPFYNFYSNTIRPFCEKNSIVTEFSLVNSVRERDTYSLTFQLPAVASVVHRKFTHEDFENVAMGTSLDDVSKMFGFKWDYSTCTFIYRRRVDGSNTSWRNLENCVYYFNDLRLVSTETKSNWFFFNSTTSVYKFKAYDETTTFFTFKDNDLESVRTTL